MAKPQVSQKSLWDVKMTVASIVEAKGPYTGFEEGKAFDRELRALGVDPCLLELSSAESTTIEDLVPRLPEAKLLQLSVQTQPFEQQLELRERLSSIRKKEGGVIPPQYLTLDYESEEDDGNIAGDESDSSSDSDESLLEVPQGTTNVQLKRYTIETLKSLIPPTREFDSLRCRIGQSVLVYRYHPLVSNRTFKRRYFFKHGVLPKGIEKVPCTLTGTDIIPIVGKKKALGPKTPFGGKPVVYRKVRTTLVRKDRVKSYKSLYPKCLPRRHHTKYWYFLRKRGCFRTSSHHPYGDEYEAYASDPT